MFGENFQIFERCFECHKKMFSWMQECAENDSVCIDYSCPVGWSLDLEDHCSQMKGELVSVLTLDHLELSIIKS